MNEKENDFKNENKKEREKLIYSNLKYPKRLTH